MAQDTPTILVIEDEPAVRRGVCDALAFSGYNVRQAADGPAGLRMAFGAGVDFVLLDLMLPGCGGFDILREVRKARPSLPVIILTARGAEEDRVRGLDMGADDYVVKPFSARELIARVEAVRRRSPGRHEERTEFDVRGRRVDVTRREAILPDGARRELTKMEAKLLAYLDSHADRPVGREELLERVWGIDAAHVNTRTVDMHVARLREKLADTTSPPVVIVTIRGRGYMIGQSHEKKPT